MMCFSLKSIEVIDQSQNEKYQYMYSVDTLNEWVKEGMPFREAYQKMGKLIAEGGFTPNKTLNHTHIGSIGSLQLAAIRAKMKKIMDQKSL